MGQPAHFSTYSSNNNGNNNVPTSSSAFRHPVQSHVYNFQFVDLPKTVISSISQGSEVKSMDFHPEHQTLLLVGTSTGEIAIWEVGSRLRVAIRSFTLWNIGGWSMALEASLANELPVVVNRVKWSPKGRYLGVAYSKHLVHVYSYRAGEELRDHLEIEAHVGNVNDIAFAFRHQKLAILTCGDDKTIKVWDAATGVNLHILEGHDAPVYCVCPHTAGGVQACDSFLFSTTVNGKIKAWLYDDRGSRLDYNAPGFSCTRMAYNTVGSSRLFSCGSRVDRDSFLVEWNESEGTIKRSYLGLGKRFLGMVQFDTAQRFIAAGDEHSVKFWDMDHRNVILTTNADGGLPATPCVRFNNGGILLAVSTSENGVKILANGEGIRLIKSIEKQAVEASRNVPIANTIAPCVASTSAAGASRGATARSIPTSLVANLNQNGGGQNVPVTRSRNREETAPVNVWKLKEITEPSQLRSSRLPDNTLTVRIVRLMYANSGSAVLALAGNAVHKLWKWPMNEKNTTGNATADVQPLLWQPSSGILMTNNIDDAVMEDTVPSLAISKNNSYVLSASGGKISLYNLQNFRTMTSFVPPGPPPPAATCLLFHPEDNNIVAIGMSDASIQIYNVRIDEIVKKLAGHQKRVTGFAFAVDKKIMVSSGADAQLCVWNTENWEIQASKFLQIPPRRTTNSITDTRVQINPDQTRLLVVHETQIAIYDPLKLDCLLQWVPRQGSGSITDAAYSCDGLSIYVSIEDGSVSVLSAKLLRTKCRIDPKAYLPSSPSTIRLTPTVIAAHPSEPNQFAIGLSDGGVCILEPLKSDNQWGTDPSAENGAGSSTTHVAGRTGPNPA